MAKSEMAKQVTVGCATHIRHDGFDFRDERGRQLRRPYSGLCFSLVMNRRRSKALGAPILPPLVSKENGPSGGAATGAVFSSDAPRGDAAPGSEDHTGCMRSKRLFC